MSAQIGNYKLRFQQLTDDLSVDDAGLDDCVSTYWDLKLIAEVLSENGLDNPLKQPVGITPHIGARITDWSYHEAKLLFGHRAHFSFGTQSHLTNGLSMANLPVQ